DDGLAGVHARSVEAHDTIATVERNAMAEALDYGEVVAQLAPLVGDPVDHRVDHAGIDDARRDVDEVGHGPTVLSLWRPQDGRRGTSPRRPAATPSIRSEDGLCLLTSSRRPAIRGMRCRAAGCRACSRRRRSRS